MSVTTAQATSLLETVLFESPAVAAVNAQQWVALSASNSADSTVAGLASAMANSPEATIPEQIFRYYLAEFGRAPQGSEVSFYVNVAETSLSASQITQGASAVPTAQWNQISTYFTYSPEFTHDYFPPGAVTPANEAIVIAGFYNNILGRVPVGSEIAYYEAQLNNGYTLATLLQEFVNSPEYQADVNPLIGPGLAKYGATGTISTPMVLYGLTADSQPSVTEGGTEVFLLKTAGVAPGTMLYYTLSGVTAANVVSGQLSGTVTVGNDGTTVIPVTLALSMDNSEGLSGSLTASLSTTQGGPSVASASATLAEGNVDHFIIDISGQGNTIQIIPSSSAFDGSLTVSGASNTIQAPHYGSNLVFDLLGGSATKVTGYLPNEGIALHVVNTTSTAHLSLLNGASAGGVAGSSLNFNGNTSYAVLTGSLGDGSTAAVLQAFNTAYSVADKSGEAVTFIGQDNAGNTEIWFFGSTAGALHGVIPSSSLASGADLNANRMIDANEVKLIATLVNIAPTSLVAADLV